jgi:hypothetical protein
MVAHLNAGKLHEALGVLDSAEGALKSQDGTGWLERELLQDRALLLESGGQDRAALALLEKRINLGFAEPSDEASARFAAALILSRMHRAADASKQMARALDALEKSHPRAALPMLLTWLEHGDVMILEQRPGLVNGTLLAHGLVAPVSPLTDPVGALRWARETWREGNGQANR